MNVECTMPNAKWNEQLTMTHGQGKLQEAEDAG